MPVSILGQDGRVTIPKTIRARLGLVPGDEVEITAEEDERIVIRRSRDGDRVLGTLRDFAPEEPVSVEEMKEAVRRRAAERNTDRR